MAIKEWKEESGKSGFEKREHKIKNKEQFVHLWQLNRAKRQEARQKLVESLDVEKSRE